MQIQCPFEDTNHGLSKKMIIPSTPRIVILPEAAIMASLLGATLWNCIYGQSQILSLSRKESTHHRLFILLQLLAPLLVELSLVHHFFPFQH